MTTRVYIRIACTVLLIFVFGTDVSAHAINYAMERVPASEVAWFYLKLGFRHIVPDGLDHILFITALCLANNKLKTILWQATAFTLAHCITLVLSMRNVVTLPDGIVEPVIALSIAFVAIENLLLKEWNPWKVVIVFAFGLIHGLGFASSLSETGLPRNQFFTSIISFNAGVEIGQIAVVAGAFLFLILPFKDKSWYRKFVVYPASVLIGLVALYWTFQRIL